MDDIIVASDYRFSSPFPWILQILARVPPDTLKALRFTVVLDSPDDLNPEDEPLDWGAMDQLLTNARFSVLRQLVFLVSGALPYFLAKAMLQHNLPLVLARGILTVRPGSATR